MVHLPGAGCGPDDIGRCPEGAPSSGMAGGECVAEDQVHDRTFSGVDLFQKRAFWSTSFIFSALIVNVEPPAQVIAFCVLEGSAREQTACLE